MLIATIATEYPEKSYENYKTIFNNLGIKNIEKLDISVREEAFEKENIDLIKEADLLFFTGGDQLRITSMIGGSPVYDAIKELCINGYVVGKNIRISRKKMQTISRVLFFLNSVNIKKNLNFLMGIYI